MQPTENKGSETPTEKPAWYTRKGFPTWLIIVACVGTLSLVLTTKQDSPARLWIFLAAVGIGVLGYWYTHPSKPKNGV